MPESDDSLYKRIDDKKWRERTEERIVNLQNGEATQNDRLEEIEDELKHQDKILRGDPAGGIIEQIDELAAQLRRINAVLWPDATGNGGMINEVRRLVKKDEREERRADRWWKGITPIIVALVSMVGLALMNLERIVSAYHLLIGQTITNSAKPSKKGSKRNGIKRKPAPAPEPAAEEPETE